MISVKMTTEAPGKRRKNENFAGVLCCYSFKTIYKASKIYALCSDFNQK